MKYVCVSFKNYNRVYTFKTSLDLVVGAQYKLEGYATPVKVVGYTEEEFLPGGINIKEITSASEVVG